MDSSRFWVGFIYGAGVVSCFIVFINAAWFRLKRDKVKRPVLILGGIFLGMAAAVAIAIKTTSM